jgi:hypothetical protein
VRTRLGNSRPNNSGSVLGFRTTSGRDGACAARSAVVIIQTNGIRNRLDKRDYADSGTRNRETTADPRV